MVDARTSQGAGLYTANVVFNQPILTLDHESHSRVTEYGVQCTYKLCHLLDWSQCNAQEPGVRYEINMDAQETLALFYSQNH